MSDPYLIGTYHQSCAQQIVEEAAANMVGVFTWVSFSHTADDGGKNIGVVVVQCGRDRALARIAELGLTPQGPYDVMLFPVDDLEAEGLVANRFYSREEMAALGHGKIEVSDE